MKKPLTIFGHLLLALMLCVSQGAAQAQDAVFSEAELDQMMAPIALYPDSLLAQILMATTYPADVAEAVSWSKDNSDRDGDADGTDFLIWQDAFGSTGGGETPQIAAVPEPQTLVLLLVGAMTAAAVRRWSGV